MAELVDSRRLTGPNLHDLAPGAVAELRFGPEERPAAFITRWREALAQGLRVLGWQSRTHARRFTDTAGREGAELMFTAAVDRLYAATELNEWAIAEAGRAGQGAPDLDALEAVAAAAEREQGERRGALELIARAEAEGAPWLIDDEELTLGYFDAAQSWPVGELPAPDSLDWSRYQGRPVALITGTNGKTTTTRLLARMFAKAGVSVGNTSTDGLYVDEQLVEAGDWTGPGGARSMLRRPELELALLEAARGGLLRRGLGVRSCELAIITNVERDHLGEYGIFDLQGMAAAKGIVATVVDPEGLIVLGADSPALVEWAQARLAKGGPGLPARVAWFSLDPELPLLTAHERAGGEVWTVVDGWLVRRREGGARKLVPAADLPCSLGGRARHNVANALAAAAAARFMGVEERAIVSALLEFGSRPEDNPGRARVWSIPLASEGGGSVDLLIDFAHNLAGLEAIAATVLGLAEDRGRRPILSFGMAGDRSDADIRGLGAALVGYAPKYVVLREQLDYLRGRERGEVPKLLAEGLAEGGFDEGRVSFAEDEPGAIAAALEQAEAGDLIVSLVHTEREAVQAWLKQAGARVRLLS